MVVHEAAWVPANVLQPVGGLALGIVVEEIADDEDKGEVGLNQIKSSVGLT